MLFTLALVNSPLKQTGPRPKKNKKQKQQRKKHHSKVLIIFL